MELEKAYQMVLQDIAAIDIGLLMGRWDAKHGNIDFMYGIELVMDTLAERAGPEGKKFMDNFDHNYFNSLKKAGMA